MLKKKPVGDATGVMSQPHSLQARRFTRDALGLDNGGGSGSGYSAHIEPFTLQL
jgi:hypothetical protein